MLVGGFLSWFCTFTSKHVLHVLNNCASQYNVFIVYHFLFNFCCGFGDVVPNAKTHLYRQSSLRKQAHISISIASGRRRCCLFSCSSCFLLTANLSGPSGCQISSQQTPEPADFSFSSCGSFIFFLFSGMSD